MCASIRAYMRVCADVYVPLCVCVFLSGAIYTTVFLMWRGPDIKQGISPVLTPLIYLPFFQQLIISYSLKLSILILNAEPVVESSAILISLTSVTTFANQSHIAPNRGGDGKNANGDLIMQCKKKTQEDANKCKNGKKMQIIAKSASNAPSCLVFFLIQKSHPSQAIANSEK